jgi:hypothetical protein
MAQNDVWEKARAQLVKQRQIVIEALAKGYEKGTTEDTIESLLKIQAAIDVLDVSDDELEDEDDDDE